MLNSLARRSSLFLAVLLLVCLSATSNGFTQVTARIENISPVNSDLDGSNPNSASGGRVNQLAAHPTSNNIFFAASEWGGLYRTEDAGRNWRYVPQHVPQAMWDVEFKPDDPSVLVATSFFDGKTSPRSGINISLDGGVSWSTPSTAQPGTTDCADADRQAEPGAMGIAFDPADTDNVYVGTHCGLAISRDSGNTWNYVDPTPGDGGGNNVWDVIVHNGDIIDICGDDGHLRSTDGGTTFVAGANDPPGRCSLAVSPDESNVLFLSVGTQLFESRDAGASWPTIFTNPAPQGRIPFVKVNDRTGPGFDLWFGDTALFRAGCATPANLSSTSPRCPNSGSWTRAQQGAHADVGDLAFDTTVSVNSCPLLFSNDGGIYYNQRTGAGCHAPNWEQPDTSVMALWLWDMDGNSRSSDQEEGIYIGQQDSGAFGTRDGGKSTRDWNSPVCCDVFDVEAEDNRVVYTVCCSLPPSPRLTRMFIDGDEMDGGSEVPNYPPGNLFGFRDTDSVSNYAPNSYAVVTSNGIYFTSNIGVRPISWNILGTAQPTSICGVYSSMDNNTPVFTARVGGCSLGDIGALWQHVGATNTGGWVRIERDGQSQFGAFGVNPTDADHLIANDLSGVDPTMVQTLDGGQSWSKLIALNQYLTGNGDFLIETLTGGPFGNGYAQASMVAISQSNRNMIVVGGQDSGVFLSVDGGMSWKLLTDPRTNDVLRPHISRPLFAHFESLGNAITNLYIGARGRGAWRIRLESRSIIDNPETLFSWSFSGPSTDSRFPFCTQINEPSEAPRFDWHDNYLCSRIDIGLQWSFNNPISGMRCTQIIEPSEPPRFDWDDNYLCLPPESPVHLTWNYSASTNPGAHCVQIIEPSEPPRFDWHDNYLCATQSGYIQAYDIPLLQP